MPRRINENCVVMTWAFPCIGSLLHPPFVDFKADRKAIFITRHREVCEPKKGRI